MRLTGGNERGRRIRAPRGLGTRPTAAKVREALFNILGPPPDGAVLDLFAGTGSLGIEALSRGAGRAVFIERDRQALVALRENLKALSLGDRATVVAADVKTGLRRLAVSLGHEDRFSWVFLDPPYASDGPSVTDAVLAELTERNLLARSAVVMVEHDAHHRPPASVGGLFLTDRREYGETELSFYRSGHS
jgi:16S rRNA (guanine966-N2)-methyltransferase